MRRDVLEALSAASRKERAAREAPRAPGAHHAPRMRVHVVCYEDPQAWILGKIARRLHEELTTLGHDATLGRTPDSAAEVNHHVIYYDYAGPTPTLETVMITHIDEPGELAKVQRQLGVDGVAMGICMSYEAVHRLAHFGVPRRKLCFVSPAHDAVVRPRPVVVGLATRLYPDGRKREHLLPELARHLSPDEFRFVIMGRGWEPIVADLRGRGFAVDYADAFEPEAYRALLPNLDYYLYLGQDEGSIGFLDALAAGVPTIVTAQGFHLDVPGGITHAFTDLADLRRVFEEIAEPRRRRIAAVAGLGWGAYARRHLVVWDWLLRRRDGKELPASLVEELGELAVEIG